MSIKILLGYFFLCCYLSRQMGQLGNSENIGGGGEVDELCSMMGETCFSCSLLPSGGDKFGGRVVICRSERGKT